MEFHVTGSEGGGEETTGRKAGIGASPPTVRARPGYGSLSHWTTNGSAARLARVRAVHRHDIGGLELPIGGSSSTVAVAMRQRR